MNKLFFVCVGPQRTATSWLDRLLRKHPDLALPEVVKETFFLDRDYKKGWDWYWSRYFPSVPNHDRRVRGEIASTLLNNSAAIERVKAHNAGCKIIICVRDPVARSLSLFEHYLSTSRVPNDWGMACRKMPAIIEASQYCRWISEWSSNFGADSVLLVSHKQVSDSPQDALDTICNFLGVSLIDELSDEEKERYGEASTPRSKRLVWLLNRVARMLRSFGLHRLVNAGKAIGVKRLFFYGGERPELNISASEREALSDQFGSEYRLIEFLNVHGGLTASACEHLVEYK